MQWHPAHGGAIRRLVLPRRVVLGLVLALAIASSAVAAGGLSAGLERSRVRAEVAAASHENRSLRARQAALSSDLLEQGRQSGLLEDDGERHRRCKKRPAER